MKSSNVLESLRDSLKNYIVSNYSGQVPDICELYPLDLNMLDDRSDIPGIRIGIYEQSDDPSVIASDTNVLDTLQIYNVQLFFRIGRRGDPYRIAEKLMLDYKDLCYDWAYQLNPGLTTNNELVSFWWAGSDQIIRDYKYTSMNILFESHRNLRA